MPIDDYLPFDPDSTSSDSQDEVDYIFSQMNYSSWRDVLFDIQDNPNDEYVRPARYQSIEEALFDAWERGILDFTSLVYYEDEDLYGIYIEYEEGAT